MLLDKFQQNGEPYPDPDARLRQVHTVQVKSPPPEILIILEDFSLYMIIYQMTENFIVVPETSYMYDPCVRYVRIVTITCM